MRCKCGSKTKWVIIHYKHNHSHFEYPKDEEHYSDYSTVKCTECGMVWRTKAKYVETLRKESR